MGPRVRPCQRERYSVSVTHKVCLEKIFDDRILFKANSSPAIVSTDSLIPGLPFWNFLNSPPSNSMAKKKFLPAESSPESDAFPGKSLSAGYLAINPASLVK